MSSTISRIADRLRNLSQLSKQVGENELADQKIAINWPNRLREFGQALIEMGREFNKQASETEAYVRRREEDFEALMILSQTSADLATIVGREGKNLKILTHKDPDYILSILTEADLEACKIAINKLTPEQKQVWQDLIKS